ncbi:thermonuclease family protein [Actinomycetospora termitidis]|uniref:Thermonuclease family protein n=1 Tax=Actinomycetospora termitidis TaxID=3053470 RepID=A0ABT7M232_9PSEU|nr:thermonuclease family protein [Actinomycetospora sp. Odt1-22]MDL5154481.1 thermonuclease family protein [Actinomycetospora sp. Odt1-22]
MRIVALVIGAVTAVLLLAGCVPQTATRSSSSAPATAATASPVAADAVGTDGAASSAMVTRVIDGDTFVITGGTEVRVLGIDSCEAPTVGGRKATRAAEDAILGQSVRLTAEPGVDRDRYDRQLRYVSYSGGDFAEMMVRADHTAIYTKGRNDASVSVQARLRSLDGNGRTCGGTTTTTRPQPAPVVGNPSPKPQPKPVATPKPAPRPVAAAPKPAPSVGAFKNCTEARAAGAAPLYRGGPGYAAKLDRDGDGVACE